MSLRPLAFAVAMLVLAALVAGCRTPAPGDSGAEVAVRPASEVPEERVALEPPAESAAVSEVMGLEDVLALAFTRNENILQSSQGIAVARSAVDGTYGRMFMPRFTASAGATRTDPVPGLVTDFGSIPMQDKDLLRFGLELRVPIFHPANALYLYDAAELSTDVSRLTMRRTEQQIRFVVTQAFFGRMSLERQRDVIQEFIRSLGSQAEEVRVRVDAGAAIENDVLKIQLELTRQRQQLVEIENAIELAAMRLNALLALPRDTTYELRWEREFAPAELAAPARLVAVAEDERPDLRSFDVVLRQLELRRQGERAKIAPHLDAFAGLAHTSTDVFDEQNVGTIGLQLTWEVFDGGVRHHRAAQYLHEIYQTSSRQRNAKREVALEVEGSLREIENQASAVGLGRTAVEQATENLRVQRALYRNQRSTANDLLEAEVQLTRARNTVIQATYAHEIALGQLEAATGAVRERLGRNQPETPE